MSLRTVALVVAPALAALSLLAAPAAAQAPLNTGIEVVNDAGVQITQLYARPAAAPGWGDNKLARPLPPGEATAIRDGTESNCMYDLRAVYQDGRSEERPANVCRGERVVFSGG